MVALSAPILVDPTLEAVDRRIEEIENAKPPRSYVGMSAIGHQCSRALWYGYRWATKRQFDAETLKRFEDGHHGEDLQAARLRLLPCITLQTHDENGDQFGFSDETGHFKGHMDGAILGLLQAPKTWHVWEHKQVNDKKFAKLQSLKEKLGEKSALAAWDEVYYAQGVLYMHVTGMNRHYLTCSTPGGRKTISVRTNSDEAFAIKLIAKAQTIINAPRPLPKISNDPSWFFCKSFCDFKEVCHGSALPARHCRSCIHSSPMEGGEWGCDFHEKVIDRETQEKGCPHHRFIPDFVHGKQIKVIGDNIIYTMPDGREWIDA